MLQVKLCIPLLVLKLHQFSIDCSSKKLSEVQLWSNYRYYVYGVYTQLKGWMQKGSIWFSIQSY